MIHKILFFFVVGFWCPTAAAKECMDSLHVFFVNGLFNLPEKAEENMEKLKGIMSPRRVAEKGLRWKRSWIDVGYNQHKSHIEDLYEVVVQKNNESITDFWIWFADFANAPEKFKYEVRRIYRKYELETTRLDLEQMALKIDSQIMFEEKRVLVVAHSQENFFANQLVDIARSGIRYHWIRHRKSLRLVSVATPAARVADNGSYVTLRSDGIVKWLPNTLPPNVSNTVPSPGFFDHEFIKHYLEGDGSRAAIESAILTEAEKLGLLSKNEETRSKNCI